MAVLLATPKKANKPRKSDQSADQRHQNERKSGLYGAGTDGDQCDGEQSGRKPLRGPAERRPSKP